MCYFEVPSVSVSEVILPALLPILPRPRCVSIDLFHTQSENRELKIEKMGPSQTGIVMEYWNKGILYEVNISTEIPPHSYMYIELWERIDEGHPISHDSQLFAWNGDDYQSVPDARISNFDIIKRINLDM